MCRRRSREVQADLTIGPFGLLFAEQDIFAQFERAEMEFIVYVDRVGLYLRWRLSHQRECRMGKLLPDGEVIRRDGQPAKFK